MAAIIPPSPRHILEDLTADSNMDSSSPIPSEEIPTSSEGYQIFPEDIPESSILSSLVASLPAGYRSLSQVMAAIASMSVLAPAMEPAASLLGMSPSTPVTSSPFVTSVPIRPTACVGASSPVITSQSVGITSAPEDVYMASIIPDGLSPDEYRLAV